MLWTLFVILFGLWLIGMAFSQTFGGVLHLLLVLSLVVLVVQLLRQQRPM